MFISISIVSIFNSGPRTDELQGRHAEDHADGLQAQQGRTEVLPESHEVRNGRDVPRRRRLRTGSTGLNDLRSTFCLKTWLCCFIKK